MIPAGKEGYSVGQRRREWNRDPRLRHGANPPGSRLDQELGRPPEPDVVVFFYPEGYVPPVMLKTDRGANPQREPSISDVVFARQDYAGMDGRGLTSDEFRRLYQQQIPHRHSAPDGSKEANVLVGEVVVAKTLYRQTDRQSQTLLKPNDDLNRGLQNLAESFASVYYKLTGNPRLAFATVATAALATSCAPPEALARQIVKPIQTSAAHGETLLPPDAKTTVARINQAIQTIDAAVREKMPGSKTPAAVAAEPNSNPPGPQVVGTPGPDRSVTPVSTLLPPAFQATPQLENGSKMIPLQFICPDPKSPFDPTFKLEETNPKLHGEIRYGSLTRDEIELVRRIRTAVTQKFGDNDIVICLQAAGGGISPVITQVTQESLTGEGNYYVLLNNDKLVGAKDDSLFTPETSFLKSNEVKHYSFGRIGDGRFSGMAIIEQQKTPSDPIQIVAVLDPQSGKYITGKEMIRRYSQMFRKIPATELLLVSQLRQSMPPGVAQTVDSYGFYPSTTPAGNEAFRMVALSRDGKVLWPQEAVSPPPAPQAIVIDMKTGAPVDVSKVQKVIDDADKTYRDKNYGAEGYAVVALSSGSDTVVAFLDTHDKTKPVKLVKQPDGTYLVDTSGNFIYLSQADSSRSTSYYRPDGSTLVFDPKNQTFTTVATDGSTSTQPLPGEIRGLFLYADLESSSPGFVWKADSMSAGDLVPPAIGGSSVQLFDHNPTPDEIPGVKFDKYFSTQIYSSIGSKEGPRKDGRHRAYIPRYDHFTYVGDKQFNTIETEVWLYFDDVDEEIGTNLSAIKGKNIFSLAGGMLVGEFEPYISNILYRKNDKLFILPFNYNPAIKNTVTGKLIDDNASIPLRKWTKINEIVNDDGVWILINGIPSSYISQFNPGQRRVQIHFGPYAVYEVNRFSAYQAGHKVKLFNK